jgi:hypothetical protein
MLAGAAQAADPSTLVYTESSSAFWLTPKDGNLFWVSPACGAELLPPTIFIRSEPALGPTAHTIFNPPECPSNKMFNNTRIAVDDADIYWADGDNQYR